MSDVESNDELGISNTNDVLSGFLVDKLKENEFLLNKSYTLTIKNKKKQVLASIIEEWNCCYDEKIDEKRVLKKIANMKSRAQKKRDLNKQGNIDVVLKEWEEDLLKLLANAHRRRLKENEMNYSQSSTEFMTVDLPVSEVESQTSPTDLKRRFFVDLSDYPAPNKQPKLEVDILCKYETEETQNLTKDQLERLVLLKQNQVLTLELKKLENETVCKY